MICGTPAPCELCCACQRCRSYCQPITLGPVDNVEVAVIGAGVVGLAVARAFARQGRDTLLLEAAATFGTEISSRDFVKLAEGFGCLGVRSDLDGLPAALAAAYGADRPTHDVLQPFLCGHHGRDDHERRGAARVHRARGSQSWRRAKARRHDDHGVQPQLGPGLRARPALLSHGPRAPGHALYLERGDKLSGHVLFREPRGLCRGTRASRGSSSESPWDGRWPRSSRI